MKIFRFFFLLLLLSAPLVNSFAGGNNNDKILEIYKDSLLLSRATYSHWKDTVWQKNTQISYIYDEKGNMLEMLWQYWDPVVLHLFKKTDFFFNDKNQLKTEMKSNWQSDQWQNQSRVEYTYDISGNKIESAFNTWVYDSYTYLWYWWCDNKTEYVYSGGTLQSATNLKRSGVDYVYDTRHIYHYLPNNLLSEDITQGFSDSLWQDELKSVNIYYNKNRILLAEVYYPSDSVWLRKSCDSSWYDVNGMLRGHIAWDIQSGDSVFSMETFTYDTNKLLSESISSSLNDSVWTPVQRNDYSYNGANLIEKITYYQWNGSSWTLYNKDEFEYWKIRTSVGDNPVDKDYSINVIPQSNKILLLKTKGIEQGIYFAELFDIEGNHIFSGSVNIDNTGETQILPGELIKGVYFIKLTSSRRALNTKFIMME